jgi:hypothetical protein
MTTKPKELPIGETRAYYNRTLKAVEQTRGCGGCHGVKADIRPYCHLIREIMGECGAKDRTDGKAVYFKEV